jgi:hypothetical protein
MRCVAFALVLSCAALLACRSEPEKQGLELEPLQLPVRTWTTHFRAEAVLVADEIAIEGPYDLVEHVALRQDPETGDYSSKTIPEGLFQELAAKATMGAPVLAQLDGWSLAAARRITVLQRPGDVPVLVRARGNAYWAAAAGRAERRENELVFEGQHEVAGGGN